MNSPSYADVIIDISHEQVDRPFQYRIPDALRGQIEPGTPVKVPFGKGDGTRLGFVISLSGTPEIDPGRIKEIFEIAKQERETDAVRIRLAAWMKERYGGTLIQSLKTVLNAMGGMDESTKELLRNLAGSMVAKTMEPAAGAALQAAQDMLEELKRLPEKDAGTLK